MGNTLAVSEAGSASQTIGSAVFDPDKARGCLSDLVSPFDSYNKNPSPISI